MSAVSISRTPTAARENLLARLLPGRSSGHRRLRVLGVGIDDLGFEDAVTLMRGLAREGSRRTIYIVNAHTLNLASASRRYRAVLDSADFVFNDGIGVRLAARLQGIHLKANLNGTDLVPAFMHAANEDRLSYYLLGATPQVLSRTIAVMASAYPGWRLAGHHHGYLDRRTSDDVIEAINEARPQLLLVGMGNPIQENWIHDHRDRLETNLCIGVGGLLSYLSGDYRRAPLWMRRIGLEWGAIIVLQPRKWRRYVIGNPLFLARVAREHFKRKSGS